MGGPSQGPRRSGPRPEDRGALDSKTVPGGALSQDTLLPTCEGGGPQPLTTRNPRFPGPRLRAVPLAQPGFSGHLPSGQHLPGRQHPEPWPTDPQPTHRGLASDAGLSPARHAWPGRALQQPHSCTGPTPATCLSRGGEDAPFQLAEALCSPTVGKEGLQMRRSG